MDKSPATRHAGNSDEIVSDYDRWAASYDAFTDSATGVTVYVAAHVHTIGDCVNGGIAVGLTLSHLGEWLGDGASRDAPPRLLSALFNNANS